MCQILIETERIVFSFVATLNCFEHHCGVSSFHFSHALKINVDKQRVHTAMFTCTSMHWDVRAKNSSYTPMSSFSWKILQPFVVLKAQKSSIDKSDDV